MNLTALTEQTLSGPLGPTKRRSSNADSSCTTKLARALSRPRPWLRLLACLFLTSLLAVGAVHVAVHAQDAVTEGACEGAESFVRLPLAVPSAPRPTKPWNILLYAAADIHAGQGFNPLEPFASYVSSGPHVNVLILEDEYTSSRRAYPWEKDLPWARSDYVWSVEHQTCGVRITPVLALGEAETDKPETLEQFLRFAQEWFPAERTLLFLYGHGRAWEGACTDESGKHGPNFNSQTWLTPSEMQTALGAVGGVDALMFSAPCNMASLEAAYEVREVTDLFVGSEEASGYIYWWAAVGRIAGALQQNPDLDILALGEIAIDAIREENQEALDEGYWPHTIVNLPNIAAIRSSALENLASAVDQLAASALSVLPEQKKALLDLRAHLPQFGGGQLVDIYALAHACTGIPGLSEAADGLMQAVDVAVLSQVSPGASPQGEAGGLSLYFPRSLTALSVSFDKSVEAYLDCELSFLANTRWDEALEALIGLQTSP
jgi:hypothetical protein